MSQPVEERVVPRLGTNKLVLSASVLKRLAAPVLGRGWGLLNGGVKGHPFCVAVTESSVCGLTDLLQADIPPAHSSFYPRKCFFSFLFFPPHTHPPQTNLL